MFSFLFGVVKFVIGVLWLLITIGVLVNLWGDDQKQTGSKVLWTLGVLLFPVLGPVLYILLSKRDHSV